MATPRGYRSVVYFANWTVYVRGYRPQDLPAEHITHILYAFANVRPETGEVVLTDAWADTGIHWEGDTWDQPGNNMFGCMKQINILKQRNRNLKVLLSIGGYTNSANFTGPASRPQDRVLFAESAVKLVKELGFDGLDIDWEYPQNATDAANYVQLLYECRKALDTYGDSLSPSRYHFELTVAVPAGPQNFQLLDVPAMDRYLDFWNLMSYDYAGAWSSVSGHQANVYPHQTNAGLTPCSSAVAVHYYQSRGVATNKIVLGLPLYGRAFANTNGLGQPFEGTGPGSFEAGIWDFKVLPPPDAQEQYDPELIASSCYDPKTRTFITYDTKPSTLAKATFIQDRGLGGAMWWEASGDREGPASLVRIMSNALGGPANLKQQPNCITYPESPYDNLRNGFQQ